MKTMRWLAVAVLFAPGMAWGAAAAWNAEGVTGSRSRIATCAASGTCDAPSAATDGILLDGVDAVAIVVCAASGQTISSGSVTLYYYDAKVGLWAKSSQTFSPVTGSRCAEVPGDSPGRGIPILARRGRLAPKLDITASGAGDVTMYVLASSRYEAL